MSGLIPAISRSGSRSALSNDRKIRVNQAKRPEGGARIGVEFGNMPVRFGEGLLRLKPQLGQHGEKAVARLSGKNRFRRRAVAKERVSREIDAPARGMHRQSPHQPGQPVGKPGLEGRRFER